MAAMFAALVCVATVIIQITMPQGGYINLGAGDAAAIPMNVVQGLAGAVFGAC